MQCFCSVVVYFLLVTNSTAVGLFGGIDWILRIQRNQKVLPEMDINLYKRS